MKNKKQKKAEKISPIRINTKFRVKLVVLFGAVILALILLALRITYINATKGEAYKRIVLSNIQQQYQSRVIPFKRGDITDRNGTLLATSERVYNLVLDCVVVNYESEDDYGEMETAYKEPTIDALVKFFALNEEELYNIVDSEETKNSRYQILLRDVSMDEKEAFEAYCDPVDDGSISKKEANERANIQGVWFEESFKRIYPQNSMACDTIGFTYAENEASWGIEGYYNAILNGVDGRKYGYFNDDEDVEQTIIPAENGNNVISTIDINVQQIIRNAIMDFRGHFIAGPNGTVSDKGIAVIVMDPNNGEILGMDSTDWYDLNDPRNLEGIVSNTELAGMSENQKIEKLNEIWRNFCVSDAYEPGSVVKPVTIAAGLETASINDKEIFECDGGETIAGTEVHCAIYPGKHGKMNIYGGIAESCNDVLMQVVRRIGAEKFIGYLNRFYFGSRTGVDLPGENAGILYEADSIVEMELMTSSFGQGFTCTMVQEAAAISSIINGGYYYKPHVVSAITDSDGNIVERYEPIIKAQTVSKSTSEKVIKAMGESVKSGTSEYVKVNGYSMGGKTGTAEKLPRGDGRYLTSFIGFAPLNNPKVLVYVIVDEPNVEAQDTSRYAQLVAYNVFKELLPYLGVFPDEPLDPLFEKEAYFYPFDPVAYAAAKEAELKKAQGIYEEPENAEGSEGSQEERRGGGEGISDDLPAPPEAPYDETVLIGGNDIFSEGIENDAIGVFD